MGAFPKSRGPLIPNFKTKIGPSVAYYRDRIATVWVPENSNDIKFLFSSGIHQSKDGAGPDFDCTDPKILQGGLKPARNLPLVVYDGKLLMLFENESPADMKLWKYDDASDSWAGYGSAFSSQSDKGATLGTIDSRLLCAYARDRRIYWREWNGAAWSDEERVGNESTSFEMSFFTFDNHLHLVFAADEVPRRIRHVVLNPAGDQWEGFYHDGPTTFTGIAAVGTRDCGAIMLYRSDVQDSKAVKYLYASSENPDRWAEGDFGRATDRIPSVTFALTYGFFTLYNRLPQGEWFFSFGAPYLTSDCVDMSNWMGRLTNGDEPMCNFSIPGTHDSAAHATPVPTAECQGMDFLTQMNAGIRYFDMRLTYPDLVFHHGVVSMYLQAKDVFGSMCKWLKEHPKEALMVQIKNESDSKDDWDFARAVHKVIKDDFAEYFRLSEDLPTLNQLRGKIQVLRRFSCPDDCNFGVDLSKWAGDLRYSVHRHNADTNISWHEDTTIGSVEYKPRDGLRPAYEIQDWYQPSSEAFTLSEWHTTKWSLIKRSIDRAVYRTDPVNASTLVINYVSCSFVEWSREGHYQTITPHTAATGDVETPSAFWPLAAFDWMFTEIAKENAKNLKNKGLNDILNKYLKKGIQANARLGMIMMDYPEHPADLIWSIIRTNYPYSNFNFG